MLFKKEIRKPILALMLLSVGGLLLHLRIHPFWQSPSYYLPFVSGLLSILIIPILFNSKKTVIIAYLLNGIGVLVGIIAMTYFSLSALPSPLTPANILLGTTLANSVILYSKFFLGKTILLYFYPTGLGRFFNSWWWIRHFFYFFLALSLGHFFWR